MHRIEEREQERNGDAVHLRPGQQRQQGVHRRRRQVVQNGAGVVNAFRQAETERPGRQGRRAFHIEVIKIGPVLAPDFQHILKTHCGDQGGASAFAFQQGIGGHGAAVDEIGGRAVDAGFGNALDNAPGRVRRRGG